MTTIKTVRWIRKPRSGGSLNRSCRGVDSIRFGIGRTPCHPTRRIDPGVCLRIAMKMK